MTREFPVSSSQFVVDMLVLVVGLGFPVPRFGCLFSVGFVDVDVDVVGFSYCILYPAPCACPSFGQNHAALAFRHCPASQCHPDNCGLIVAMVVFFSFAWARDSS